MTINNISALLEQLNCKAGAAELARQSKSINCQGMAIEERLMNALDAEIQQRTKTRSARLQKQAKLAYEHIFVQDINYSLMPSLNVNLVDNLSTCNWVRQHHNLLLIGPTNTGKTILSCALAQEAISRNLPVCFYSQASLLLMLMKHYNDKTITKYIESLNRIPLLIIDDWGSWPLGDKEKFLLSELITCREGKGSTLITSQYTTKEWEGCFHNDALANSVLARITNNAITVTMTSLSRRRRKRQRRSFDDLTSLLVYSHAGKGAKNGN